MTETPTLERIPEPKRQPIVGNMLSIDANAPLQGMMEMTRSLGPIFRLDMMGTPLVIASGADIVEELCDESRFGKTVRGPLRRIRAIGGTRCSRPIRRTRTGRRRTTSCCRRSPVRRCTIICR